MHHLIVKFRSALLVFLTHHLALPLLRLVRAPENFPFTREALHQLPPGSLGKELVVMLDKKNLKLLPHYARHDIKHILLQYDTTDEGEVCLQSFMLGNGHISFPVVATILFGAFTMPGHWGKFRQAYRRGSRCRPVQDWNWYTLLHESAALLTEEIDRPLQSSTSTNSQVGSIARITQKSVQ